VLVPPLDEVAAALYALAPEEFTAARDASAKAAQAAGNRQLATAIKAMRKPSQGAWLVNRLARDRAEDLGRLLDLGAALREAQAGLRGDELRRLSGQRSQVVAALAREAASLARAAGRAPGPGVLREVEQTLEAALADETAAEDVRVGRLSTALQYAGFGTPAAGEGAVPKRPTRRAEDAPQRRADVDVSRLQDAAARAATEVEAAQSAVRTAEEMHRDWQRRAQEQVEALEHARREEASAALEVREALRRHKTAVKAAQAADRRLNVARER
jgi:hypothetical protein